MLDDKHTNSDHRAHCKMCQARNRQEKIVELREKGWKFSNIARELGASRQSVHRSYQRYQAHEE